MHAFISYRVATEGPAGNKLSGRLAERVRSLSIDSRHQLHIPRHGWGIYPKGAKQPVPFRQEEAKVFLDKDCLLDGQSWLAGFIQGVVSSMVFVPLLSWREDDLGSLGELSRIGVNGFDRVDNVLLELVIGMALRDEPGAATQAVLPVLIGPARPAAEGGGFETFPFYKLARLSDEPSRATNARAGEILRQLGLDEDKVEAVLGRSVKQVVDQVLRNQGVQASHLGDEEGVVTECATRVLRTVLQEMRRLRSDPAYFEQGTPMGSEVLEWLQEANLRSYAPLFVHHHLDSLESIAKLKFEDLNKLVDEHEELYPRNGRKGAMGGELKKLEKAHGKVVQKTPPRLWGLIGPKPDERALPLSERLERYKDTEASALAAAMAGNGLELLHTKAVPKWGWVGTCIGIAWALYAANTGIEVADWGNTQIVVFVQTSSTVFLGVLPLITKTARQFVDVLKLCMPLYLFLFWLETWMERSTTGNGVGVWYWPPWLLAAILLLKFRQKYFLVGFMGIILVGMLPEPLLKCSISCDSLQSAESDEYRECVSEEFSECVSKAFSANLPIIQSVGYFLLLLLSRELASMALAWRASMKSRAHHRVLWQEELSKVAASPEVMEGLKRLTDRIGKELHTQTLRAIRSLGLVARVMAFLNQKVGRWSLRGSRSKARQAHGDIDLLFDEAAMVNEPFLDLMASLVAGIRGAEGLTMKRGPVKKPQRALQKLVRVYGRDVAMLTDLVRCTVVAEDLRQVEALMATLDARSVVGLAMPMAPRDQMPMAPMDQEGEEDTMLDKSDGERILRITAISNRFDESYDDNKSGGYRDLSLNVEAGWVMREGLVSFEKVRDWETLECQQHICEIQVRLGSQHHQIVNEGLHTRYVELRNHYNG